ncbi:MAG: hypothetical protein E6Q42_09580 [Dechloromonas sp.]|nr:MAG: hypothetical protein E6Q42_09580 [Dechloromonas sp.]
MAFRKCLIAAAGLLIMQAQAQVSVDLPGLGIKVQTGDKGSSVVTNNGGTNSSVVTKSGGSSSVVTNSAGTIGPNVQLEGITILNNEVYIDGEKIPRGKSPVKSKKTGKTYVIKWGKDGSVAVQEQ